VEFYSPISNKPFWYRYYSEVDTDSLLEKKLENASTEETQSRNCATVAMKHISERLGKSVTDQELASLVSEPNKSTNLYALRQFARGLGLHCRAVKTNIRALKNLKNCQAILHLSRANHYVVFEYIDDKYVWVIDLDSNKFFYRTRLKDFGRNWNTGTALLVSDKPLDADPNISRDLSTSAKRDLLPTVNGLNV
jgi:ABC-type bacteriocin/lantibiotic exporter with double-glycine peptidase domain